MSKFPDGKWSFLGSVYLCPIARLSYAAKTKECKVWPFYDFNSGASVWSPYSAGDPVYATSVNEYGDAKNGVYISGTFDFSGKLRSGTLSGSFTAEIFEDWSLSLCVRYSTNGGKAASSTWYGQPTEDMKKAKEGLGGKKFWVRYQCGDVSAGVVKGSVGLLDVIDEGAGQRRMYPMVAGSTGAGAGFSLPSWSGFEYAEAQSGSYPDWGGKTFAVAETGGTAGVVSGSSATLAVTLSNKDVLRFKWEGFGSALGLEAKALFLGGGILGPGVDGGRCLTGTRKDNPVWPKV